MEVVIVAAIIIFLFIISRLGSSRDSGSTSRPPQSRKSSEAGEVTGVDQPQRFDAESARHVDETRVLTGPAYVTDGDTIKINRIQVRLFGVDAPEINHPYGKKAKWALHKLCKGHLIRAEITDEDDHGRTVARCYLPDGSDLSAEMVKQGLAIDWPKFSGGKYKDLEPPGIRKKLFLADARQKGRMHVWEKFESRQHKK